MTTMVETQNLTTQVYQVFIKATPERIWDAIINPEFTAKYFYGSRITVTPERRRSTSPDGSEDWGTSGARSTTRASRPRSRAA
jgi:uncharacterized protein YndB with AHSA1/START domain